MKDLKDLDIAKAASLIARKLQAAVVYASVTWEAKPGQTPKITISPLGEDPENTRKAMEIGRKYGGEYIV